MPVGLLWAVAVFRAALPRTGTGPKSTRPVAGFTRLYAVSCGTQQSHFPGRERSDAPRGCLSLNVRTRAMAMKVDARERSIGGFSWRGKECIAWTTALWACGQAQMQPAHMPTGLDHGWPRASWPRTPSENTYRRAPFPTPIPRPGTEVADDRYRSLVCGNPVLFTRLLIDARLATSISLSLSGSEVMSL